MSRPKDRPLPLSAHAAAFKHLYELANGGCWRWLGTTHSRGYGVYRFNGKWVGAHRLSYMIAKGVIPINKLVRHTCDNRNCVNPEHLKLGTPKQNTQDMMRRGRHGTRFSGRNKLCQTV